jgi:hypothetical protein
VRHELNEQMRTAPLEPEVPQLVNDQESRGAVEPEWVGELALTFGFRERGQERRRAGEEDRMAGFDDRPVQSRGVFVDPGRAKDRHIVGLGQEAVCIRGNPRPVTEQGNPRRSASLIQ